MPSKTTKFILTYLFIGICIFNISFIYDYSKNILYQNHLFSNNIKDLILSNAKKLKTSKDVNSLLKRHFEYRDNYILLASEDGQVIYSNISNKTTYHTLYNTIFNPESKDSSSLLLYSTAYIPSNYSTFADMNIDISEKNHKLSKRYIVIVGTPVTTILSNRVLIIMDLYWLFFILFILYATFHIRNYEK